MIGASLVSAAVGAGATTAPSRDASAFEIDAPLTPECQIDKLVFSKLDKLGIQPAKLCSDATFCRRAALDLTGTIPTAREVKDFLADRSPNKRAALVDRLLESDDYPDYWAMKWSDLLRIKAEFPINLWPNAVQAYHRWIRTCIAENKPYDWMAREMLTASGSNFRTPQVNFYRAIPGKAPVPIATAVALTFMGMRTANWPKERLEKMGAFFSQLGYKATAEWKEEIVFFDPAKSADGPPKGAEFPDGTVPKFANDQDPREVFADWLVNPKNPWFTKNIVNRAWSWFLGRGIIHEPDDNRPDNPPVNPELLAYLEQEMIAAKYDMKQLFRLVLNSKIYQLSPVPRSNKPETEANFAFYPLRRLEAEVLIDALCQITGTTEKYSSAIPEPYTFIPEDHRTIALADGSISSAFLEMFGRPPRDTGLESERSMKPTPAQRLHLLNSSHIQRKIERGTKLQAILNGKTDPREVAVDIYLTILSRYPTDVEMRIMDKYSQTGEAKGHEALVDYAWALLNSEEFLHRH